MVLGIARSKIYGTHAINKVTHENKQPKSKKPNYKQQPRRFQDKHVLTTSSTLHKECRFCGYKQDDARVLNSVKKLSNGSWYCTFQNLWDSNTSFCLGLQ
jgi:hypothetical protein